jgi:hypothetical protein
MLEKATLSRDEPIDNLLNAKALPHPVSINGGYLGGHNVN